MSADIEMEIVQAQESDPLIWGILNTVRSWFGWSEPEGSRPDEEDRAASVLALLERDDFSHVGRAVLDKLEEDFANEKLVTWNFSGDASFEDDSVLQTPNVWGMSAIDVLAPEDCDPVVEECDSDYLLLECERTSDCYLGGVCEPVASTVTQPGESMRSLCVGHSDKFLDEIYETMIGAQSYLDITSLTPPDGRFEAAIRNGLTYLSNTDRVLTVRYLYGALPYANTDEILSRLTRDVDLGTSMRTHVGAYRIGIDSWNHAKLIAVDGEVMITGGHNFWSEHYLSSAPIHDLSIRLTGTPADDAHYFINQLWAHTCVDYWLWAVTGRSVFPATAPSCPEDYDGELPALEKSGARVISVARMGELGENPADDALVAMIRSAQSSIRLSNQDIGPVQLGSATITDWPVDVMGEIVEAVSRGVDVYIVLSNPDSIPGGISELSGTYGNGWTAVQVANQFMKRFVSSYDTISDDGLYEDLCEHLHVSTIRFSDDDNWAAGENIGNHAKLMIVDDVSFYLGSQNFYPSNLAEHGVIVDDPSMAGRLLDTYWHPLWAGSKRTAVSGFESQGCGIKR